MNANKIAKETYFYLTITNTIRFTNLLGTNNFY